MATKTKTIELSPEKEPKGMILSRSSQIISSNTQDLAKVEPFNSSFKPKNTFGTNNYGGGSFECKASGDKNTYKNPYLTLGKDKTKNEEPPIVAAKKAIVEEPKIIAEKHTRTYSKQYQEEPQVVQKRSRSNSKEAKQKYINQDYQSIREKLNKQNQAIVEKF